MFVGFYPYLSAFEDDFIPTSASGARHARVMPEGTVQSHTRQAVPAAKAVDLACAWRLGDRHEKHQLGFDINYNIHHNINQS